VLAELTFVVNELGFDISLLQTLQINLFSQQIYLILLLGCKLVVRLLNQLELLTNDLELSFHLLTLM